MPSRRPSEGRYPLGAEVALAQSENAGVHVFRATHGEALAIKETPFRSVGDLFHGEEIEAVWVCKRDEAIDPGPVLPSSVDLIVAYRWPRDNPLPAIFLAVYPIPEQQTH